MTHDMQLSDDYVGKLKRHCLEEWLNTPSGKQYKVQYDQLKTQMDNLMKDMDVHVHEHMRSKYGQMS